MQKKLACQINYGENLEQKTSCLFPKKKTGLLYFLRLFFLQDNLRKKQPKEAQHILEHTG